MRTALILFLAGALGCVFLVQKQREHKTEAALAATPKITPQNTTPRPVSEHNWAKRALDRTKAVTDQVAAQRKADGNTGR
ncbi:MAG TPA: hypothetical protein VGW39_05785 [Chthoniobacterales bacterium]|nr:hypothetical protein [Chthoniobacterales bacterium]